MASIPRFLLPRGIAPVQTFHLHVSRPSHIHRIQAQAQARYAKHSTASIYNPKTSGSGSGSGSRNASTKANSSNQPLLEKPTRFNPPSHPARLPRRTGPRSYPGPPLSAAETQAQQARKYPHMMPAEGTFMHWFLTNQTIHVWITMGTLVSLAAYTLATNFKETSPFADMLPGKGDFLVHPIDSIGQFLQVYKLHELHISSETAERRRRNVDDAQKRSEYRKAHGIEDESVFSRWTKTEPEPAPVSDSSDSPADGSAPGDENVAAERAQQIGEKDRQSRGWFFNRLFPDKALQDPAEGTSPVTDPGAGAGAGAGAVAVAVAGTGTGKGEGKDVEPERELNEEEKRAAEEALIRAEEEEEDRRIALKIWGTKK